MSDKTSNKKKNTRAKTGVSFWKKKKNDKRKVKSDKTNKSKNNKNKSKVNKNKVNKKSKTKYKKFEKCPGYESIKKAENLEKERKFNAAIKNYKIGIESLEDYTKYNIDNAIEKRKRMERINEYRMHSQKLQNQQLNKKNNSNIDKKPNHSQKPQYLPLNKEEGYKIIENAIKYEENKKYQKAINFYEKGLLKLEETLTQIQDNKEKEKRRGNIKEWRSRQQFCKNQLQNMKSTKTKTKKLNTTKVKKLTDEPGYQFCEKGKQFEKDNKYDIAINYYEKGIPLLEDTLKCINNSSTYRERMQSIQFYRHQLQRLKNLKVRRSTTTTTTKIRRKSSNNNNNDISGGILYKNIRNGTLSIDIIKSCKRISMYHMLKIVTSSCIHLPLPFRSCVGDGLLEALNTKIEMNGSLKQRLRFFLYSYYTHDIVQTLWGDHPSMPNILINMEQHTDINNDNDDDDNDQNNEGGDEEIKFEDKYLENDAILFFRKLIENEPKVGSEIIIDSNYYDDIYDLMGNDIRINKIIINKIFKSNAKPILITSYERQSQRKYREISSFIIKYGDDLRLDCGTMHMFRFFNSIWSEEGIFYDGYNIKCLLYGVIPMGTDFGAIEFIKGVKALRNASDYFGKFNTSNIKNLVASAAGSYIASFILGVRDRHYDNVLIKDDGTLFHIDFGYVMGSTLLFDTAELAITNDLKKLITNDHWNNFIDTAVNAYMTLRLYYQEILDYSHLVFDFLKLKVDPSEWLYKMLMINQNDKKAEEIIRNKVATAPSNWNTKIKNAAHYVATL